MKSAVFASLITLASASGFQVLIGATNDPVGGGTGNQNYLVPLDVVANCDNLGSPIILKEDASDNGAACDGCNGWDNPNNFVVTRWELNDEGNTQQGFGTLTAYLKDGDLFDLLARDVNVEGSQRRVGRCERRKGDSTQCPRGLTTDFYQPFLECFGEEEDISLAT